MPSILIVDDNDAQRLALAAILADLDVQLIEAASGRQALRHLLAREVAVILMDVNMPGLDGFETAELIRARRSSEHTPIIFITAGDDAHAARGYSLGAVDYILAPVQPEVLRTKVAVFIDLYRKTAEMRAQREALRRYADQLTQLTEASLAINSAGTIDDIVRVLEQRAARIVGARAARTTLLHEAVAAYQNPLAAPGNGHGPRTEPPGVPSPGAQLAARLTARDGALLGTVTLDDKVHGEFTGEDEGILVQLAQMASIAIENTLSAEAREANRLKDEFLGVLSHELRTPLQALLTWIAILRRDGVDPTLRTRGIEVIYRSARSQLQLIEDLLDISRIIRGQLRIDPAPVDLVRVVTQALDTLKPAAAAKQVVIDWTPPDEDCTLLGDATRLQQVVWNLVANGVKFTPEGGRVSVRLRCAVGTLAIEVTDSGPGIPPAFLPYVFERFRQADSSTKRQHGGLGLGLAIVRHLVELHDGEVRAENAPEGGARVIVSLPRQHGSAVTRRVPLALPTPRVNGIRLDGLRVLLVEDEVDARESLTAALRLYGAEVRAVSSTPAALEALGHEPRPDVLLSDLGLPGEDGNTLIRAVREREAADGRRLPAVALTAYVRAEDRVGALAAGFDLHVQKPVEPLELATVVRQLADAREQESGDRAYE